MSPSDDRPFAGRAAVVTGGTRGVGLEVARLLAAGGGRVVVNGRDPEAAAAAAASIAAAGGEALAVAGSPADETVAQRLIDTCTDTFGSLDILINCAGIAEPAGSSILNVTVAQWREQIDAHLTTTFAVCRAAAPIMVAAGGGAIVNTGSHAYLGSFGGTGYPAGKGAVTSLTLAIAAELKEHKVRANLVSPGAKTRLSSGPDYERHIAELRRRGLLDEMTAAASLDAAPPAYAAALYGYLASDLARDITGGIFVAAGGFVGRFDTPRLRPVCYRDAADNPPWTAAELHAEFTR